MRLEAASGQIALIVQLVRIRAPLVYQNQGRTVAVQQFSERELKQEFVYLFTQL
jgi:hypothetical protein